MPFNLGGGELVFLLVVLGVFGGIPAVITWRRGGSAARIAATLAVVLVPYVGWVAAWVIAFTTKGLQKCPQCAEDVRKEARVCRHCGHRFADATADVETARA